MREQIRLRLGVSSTDATVNNSVLNAWIDQANAFIASETDWPWRETSTTFVTVAGTGTYTVPTDWLRTKMLKVSTEPPMKLVSIIDLEQRWYDGTVRGTPREYTIEGDAILIRPLPDQVYTVTHRYIKVEPVLDTDGDLPLMPAQFHTAIVEMATYYGHRRLGNDSSAAEAMKAYGEWRNRMVMEHRRTMAPMSVRVRPGSML